MTWMSACYWITKSGGVEIDSGFPETTYPDKNNPDIFKVFLGKFNSLDDVYLLDPFTVVDKAGNIIFKLEDPVWIAKITATLLSKT